MTTLLSKAEESTGPSVSAEEVAALKEEVTKQGEAVKAAKAVSTSAAC